MINSHIHYHNKIPREAYFSDYFLAYSISSFTIIICTIVIIYQILNTKKENND